MTRHGVKKPVFGFAVLALALSGPFSAPAPAASPAKISREERVAYLKTHAVPVRSVDPEDTDFADLEPLRRVIGNRRIVMLGEATHGDGSTFSFKVRLIKFLHERQGFDVLALESGLYDVPRVWSALKAGEDPLPTIRSGVMEDWADSLQVRPLWLYLAEQLRSNSPLELAGFDLQFTGRAGGKKLTRDLSDYLTKAGLLPEAALLVARVSVPLNRLVNNISLFQQIPPKDRPSIRTAMEKLGQALGQSPPLSGADGDERAYWIQLLKSSATLMELAWSFDVSSLGKQPSSIFNLRDRQMGENLVWLAKRAYPARRIIVWAGTSHIIRNHASILNEADPVTSMGDWVEKELGSEVYALGFTAYRGRYGELRTSELMDVKPPAENSLEDLFSKAGLDLAWLDLRDLAADGVWLREPISSRPVRFEPKTADWTRIMDGLFFIRDMRPGTWVETK
jgi:erythromycin esterase